MSDVFLYRDNLIGHNCPRTVGLGRASESDSRGESHPGSLHCLAGIFIDRSGGSLD